MPAIQRELRMLVSHFQIGDYIEYGWFRGEVIGLNCTQLQHLVRVVEVLRAASNRSCGSVQRVPFNLGREHLRPGERNRAIYEQQAQDQAIEATSPQSRIATIADTEGSETSASCASAQKGT